MSAAPAIRVLSPLEVETLIDWAAAEGWNPGLADAAAFHAADADGFLGCFVEGELAAGISAVAYGERFGFIGLYICRPDMRGKGYGRAVWHAAMTRLAGRTIGLDGVDAQFDNYQAKGFAPAYRTVRYAGQFAAQPTVGMELDIATDERRPKVLQLDRKGFPAEREAFLMQWLEPPHVTRVSVSSEGLKGYAVMRECRAGWKIGPLFAEDDVTAIELFGSLAQFAGGEVSIDVPAGRPGFVSRLNSLGFRPTFETTRMYYGNVIPLSQVVYGVASLELG